MPNQENLQERRERQEQLLRDAHSPDRTPFDYIVIGSGAGGGPLAARLALAGQRVLVLEAGCDPALADAKGGVPLNDTAFNSKTWREVYTVPGYHGSSTEDPQVSWQFSVRHYGDPGRQQKDTKYKREHDADGKGGIQYPRCARAGGMHLALRHDRGAPERLRLGWDSQTDRRRQLEPERDAGLLRFDRECLYNSVYEGFFEELSDRSSSSPKKILTFVNPREQLDEGGHGSSGWQTTSFISPLLIRSIAKGDSTFREVLSKTIFSLLRRADLRKRLVRCADPVAPGASFRPERPEQTPQRARWNHLHPHRDGRQSACRIARVAA